MSGERVEPPLVSDRGNALLVLAGHDPTGGAGVDADRATAAAFGVHARCVVTANTRQDGRRVQDIGARAPGLWLAEARAAAGVGTGEGAGTVRALKTGLLPGAGHVRAAARLLDELRARRPDLPAVVDPVLAASGGEVFLDGAGLAALREELIPRGVVLTPNLPEAARLLACPVSGLADPGARLEAARALLELGAAAVVIKGGHGAEDPVCDLVLGRDTAPLWHRHPRVPGPGLHGSGCRHATALAAGLVLGHPLGAAASAAGEHLVQLMTDMTDS